MGKVIYSRKYTVNSWLPNSKLQCYDAYGQVLLRECDDDTLNKVELVVAAHFMIQNRSTTSSSTEDYVRAKFRYDGVAHAVQVSGTTVQAGRTSERYNESVIETFYRTDTEYVIEGGITAAKNADSSVYADATPIVPPYKQNALKDGRRIVTKVNGVEYDLRNYK